MKKPKPIGKTKAAPKRKIAKKREPEFSWTKARKDMKVPTEPVTFTFIVYPEEKDLEGGLVQVGHSNYDVWMKNHRLLPSSGDKLTNLLREYADELIMFDKV